jgi:hypothetical protein
MIVACIALFVALGGTATAVTYVVSSNSQIGPGTVSGHKPPSGDHSNVIAGSINGQDVADNSVRGADINESTLGEVPSATLGGLGGESGASASCNPESLSAVTCSAAGAINLPAPSRVLILGEIRAEPDTGGGNGGGSCWAVSNLGGQETPEPVFVNGGQTDVMAMSAVTPVVGPGSFSFFIYCNETASGIRYFNGHVSAVALSPG